MQGSGNAVAKAVANANIHIPSLRYSTSDPKEPRNKRPKDRWRQTRHPSSRPVRILSRGWTVISPERGPLCP